MSDVGARAPVAGRNVVLRVGAPVVDVSTDEGSPGLLAGAVAGQALGQRRRLGATPGAGVRRGGASVAGDEDHDAWVELKPRDGEFEACAATAVASTAVCVSRLQVFGAGDGGAATVTLAVPPRRTRRVERCDGQRAEALTCEVFRLPGHGTPIGCRGSPR